MCQFDIFVWKKHLILRLCSAILHINGNEYTFDKLKLIEYHQTKWELAQSIDCYVMVI